MPNLIVQNIPHIDLPIEKTAGEIIQALQSKFAKQGYLRGLVEATLDQCVREETAVNEEILLTYLTDNWDQFFRGADMTPEAREDARLRVQDCLAGKQEEIKSQLMRYLADTDMMEERPSKYQSLIISKTELQTISHPPCKDGKPHNFSMSSYDENEKVISAIVRWGKRDRSLLYQCCGNGCLKRISVWLRPCKGCHIIYRFRQAEQFTYCDQCGVGPDNLFWEIMPISKRKIIAVAQANNFYQVQGKPGWYRKM